jgi:16S rRNA (cytosine1402-N4)-methyltransferase
MIQEFHLPVMVEEIMRFLTDKRLSVFVDCTLGDGGHTRQVLGRTSSFVVAIDVDYDAIERATQRLMPEYAGRLLITKGDYRKLPEVMAKLGIPKMDAALFDLGISSYQVDSLERGFTYREGAPLDMRMDREMQWSARDILASYSEDELERIFREYGEERFSARIAGEIVRRRNEGFTFLTADDLVKAVSKALGRRSKGNRTHPARRIFQALRIATNDELSRLGDALRMAFSLLRPGGVTAVLTYHSLEDRIVKRTFSSIEESSQGKRLNRKVIVPDAAEISRNPRARSAKLRVIERS